MGCISVHVGKHSVHVLTKSSCDMTFFYRTKDYNASSSCKVLSSRPRPAARGIYKVKYLWENLVCITHWNRRVLYLFPNKSYTEDIETALLGRITF